MKSGQQIAAENVETLNQWLKQHETELPRLADGTLNKSAVARSAGLDRQIFTTNPKAKALLEQYGVLSNRPHRPANLGAEASELLRQKDMENSRLRDLLAKRELELTRLRQEVQVARKFRAMHEVMVETMRHVKPMPNRQP